MSHCLAEGKDTLLTCKNCGKEYTLTEEGFMKALSGETEFPHVPDWYAWQRECARRELQDGDYRLQCEMEIYALIDTKCLYRIGDGMLTHTCEGFTLTGCDGTLHYTQAPDFTYSLNADFYWYQIGDVISIGTSRMLYYCIPKTGDIPVAKARIATEELYKMT